jgi:CelD/BcsL family acetyltransferase involved in cellulose biosynthesis
MALADSRAAMTEARLEMLGGASALRDLGEGWDTLAPSPFLTRAWLDAWWDAFGSGERVTAVLRGAGGELLAGAALRRTRGGLEATANVHSGDWDVVVADESARPRIWRALAAEGAGTLRLEGLVGDSDAARIARGELRFAGFRLTERTQAASPRMTLPDDPDALLASVSRNLRSQLGRRRRALEREGDVRLRTVRGGPDVGPALEAVLSIEASGWKGRSGTAIRSDPATEALYRAFVAAAAETGMLRIYLLELDGEPIAGDIGCSHRGVGYLLKTAFDEGRSRSSPGALLRADVLRASIEEGLREYDFLGGAENYKMQWGPSPRPRVEIRAFRGVKALPEWAWWRWLRPSLRAGVLRAGEARTALRSRRDATRASRSDAERPPPAQGRER